MSEIFGDDPSNKYKMTAAVRTGVLDMSKTAFGNRSQPRSKGGVGVRGKAKAKDKSIRARSKGQRERKRKETEETDEALTKERVGAVANAFAELDRQRDEEAKRYGFGHQSDDEKDSTQRAAASASPAARAKSPSAADEFADATVAGHRWQGAAKSDSELSLLAGGGDGSHDEGLASDDDDVEVLDGINTFGFTTDGSRYRLTHVLITGTAEGLVELWHWSWPQPAVMVRANLIVFAFIALMCLRSCLVSCQYGAPRQHLNSPTKLLKSTPS